MSISKYGIPLCFACTLFSNTLFADEALSKTYEFKPGKITHVDNPVFWKITISCKIKTSDNDDLLLGVMKKKSGKINGIPMKKGDSTTLVVKDGDVLHIVADNGARVDVTNKGQSTVTAKCST